MERWMHICQQHPEVVSFLEEVKETLRNPLRITGYRYDEKIKYYHKYFKQRKDPYLLVVVKYLNNHGFIITAYFTRALT